MEAKYFLMAINLTFNLEMQLNGRLYHKNGNAYEGAFRNGIPVGRHLVTLFDGILSEVCAESTVDDFSKSWKYVFCNEKEGTSTEFEEESVLEKLKDLLGKIK